MYIAWYSFTTIHKFFLYKTDKTLQHSKQIYKTEQNSAQLFITQDCITNPNKTFTLILQSFYETLRNFYNFNRNCNNFTTFYTTLRNCTQLNIKKQQKLYKNKNKTRHIFFRTIQISTDFQKIQNNFTCYKTIEFTNLQNYTQILQL